MQLPPASSANLVRAIQQGNQELVVRELILKSNINEEVQGSYPLHWAVLSLLKRVEGPSDIEQELTDRIRIPFALLKCGADYTLAQKGSQHTIFHILALHLGPKADNKFVLRALDRILKCISTIWYCKAPTKEQGKISFVAEMSNMYMRKDRRNQTVKQIAIDRDCRAFFDEQRFERAYEAAYAEYINVDLTQSN